MSGATLRLKTILGHLYGGNANTNSNTSTTTTTVVKTATTTSETTTTPPSKPAPSKPSKPSAPPKPADPEPTTTHHVHELDPTSFLERAAAIEPDAQAIYHVTANGAVLRRSYAEFSERARGLAYFLLKHGLRRVGILAPNTPAFLETIYGTGAAGAVLVPVNYRLRPNDISYILDFAEVDSIIVDEEFVPLLDEFRQTHPQVRIIVDFDTDEHDGPNAGPFNEAISEGLKFEQSRKTKGWSSLPRCRREDDTIAIPFTSGTTSKPKGCIYTFRSAYLATMANIVESGLNYHRGRCKYLWTLPMFHAMGWMFPWAVTAVRGTHYCLRKVDYALIWKILKEEGITHFNAAPTVNTMLCAHPEADRLSAPVRVTVAASPPTPHLFEQMSDLNLIPVHVYGLTETYGPITKGYHMPAWDTIPRPERYRRMARQGHGFLTSLPVRVVKHGPAEKGEIIDVARDGKEIGEVVFAGNICAKGYYKDPEATRKLFLGGVMHSGDLAVVHPDGSIQIQDRVKDIIISGGENISSLALESMLAQHPDILEVGVVAVPDEQWGERPKAFITLKPMDGGRPMPSPEAIIHWAKTQSLISRFMVPKEVEIVEELPKTSTGKIQKNVLREWTRGK